MRIDPLMAAIAVVFAAVLGTLGTRAAAPRLMAPAAASSSASAPAGVMRVKLWEKTPDIVDGSDRDADPTEPTYDIYLPPVDKANGTGVLVFPGGSYSTLSMAKEGSDIAKMLVSHNMAAFVVRYRHAPRYHTLVPLIDAQRALRTIRSKAAAYHLDPARIGVLGFSAGGHLAASVATMFDNGPVSSDSDAIDQVSARPDFAALLYPVIDFTDEAIVHKGSRTALAGTDTTLYPALSPQLHVTEKTPPVFLVHGTNDKTVPVMNSILFYEACVKAKVSAELHVFENGPHGFGLGTDAALKTWPDHLMQWLDRHKWLTPAAK